MTNQDKKLKQETPPQEDTLQSDPAQAGVALRKKAEDVLRKKEVYPPEALEGMPPEEIRLKLHELQVHQIELEMQNEQLRMAHSKLDAARVRYFQLYDLAPVGYCTLSEAGVIIEANLTFATLLGVTRGALVQRPICHYIFQEDQNIYYLHRKQLFATGKPQVCELRMVEKSGTPFWVRLDANATQNEDDASPVCRIVLTNITERKCAEENNIKLEAQYRQAQKMESVGRLAGGVAHDFNNKLTIILGYVEIVMEKVDKADSIFADLEEIRSAANHSADLTRQLLAFARKQPIVSIKLDLNDTVEGMLNMLRRLIGEDIHLAWQPKDDLWSVKMDPSQLDQILANLCVNARDAIGGVGNLTIATGNIVLDEVYCTDHLGFGPGEYVVLTVSDDGCGMDKETLSKIYEPFFTTKALGEGTGLGLAMVYGAVKQNNGFINVYSEPGLGTTFKIYLPRYVGVTTELPIHGAIQPAMGGHETILLVEDEPTILRMTTRVLQDLGYAVLPANTPGEALRLAGDFAEKISLILTDVIMPEMTGWDLAQKLVSFCPKLKSLFMSGYTFNIIAQLGKLDAHVHFIQKPFTRNELSAKVREVLKSEDGKAF